MKELGDVFTYAGKKYYPTWIPGFDYSNVSPLTQAYGFCFNKEGKLLVIESLNYETWQVPGGTIEEGETPEETLVRELIEEADVTITDIVYLGTQRVDDEDGNSVFQLRYGAKVDKLLESTPDPDKGVIIPRKFIEPSTFGEVSRWGWRGDAMVKLAMEKLNIS